MVATTHASACPLDCPDLCGLRVEVDDGRVIRVDGDERSPLTAGFVCGKVRNIADHLYGADRLHTPLVRVGPKGAGEFAPVTWDVALDQIATRLAAIKAEHGGEAIVPFHYGGSNGWLSEGGLATRFFRRLGASRCLRTLCAAPSTEAVRGLYGKVPGVALEDYGAANLIVVWGCNPSASGIHLVPVIERAVAAGATLVVVDPRRTPLARSAALHLPVRPGTDLPVALAFIRELFARGAADARFLATHARGVDELRARAEPWTLARAAEVSGCAEADLARFVELYAAASPAVIRVGWGLERNRNGGSAVAAVLALPAVANKFGVRGGGYTMSNGDAAWGVGPEPAIAEPEPATREINMALLGQALAATDAPIKALFVYNCNPTQTVPDQAAVLRGLARDDLFTVVHEQVMTDSCRWADVVLPATAFLEHREVRRGYGMMRLFDSPAVATPPGEARSNHQLFGALLTRLGLDRPGDPRTEDELVDAIFAGAHDDDLRAQLRARAVAAPMLPTPRLFVDVMPATPDGKVDLCPTALDLAATHGLYTYQPDPATAAFPLALISPAIAQQISSTFGQLRKAPVAVELAPADAAARAIRDGDTVRIWNQLGEIVCGARISTHLRPGVAVLPKGTWRFHTANGGAATTVVPQALTDLGAGPCYNDARVEIARVDAAVTAPA
ncbi:MAG: molybdopterin-dependent oxidoreductase [Myxococcales bacterium]|nr:molybdopterin-dependent oxidoreductase [Myxococcales bacterium]